MFSPVAEEPAESAYQPVEENYETREVTFRIEVPEAPPVPELTAEQEALQEQMMEQLDELFSTPTQLCVPTRWEFITASPELLDDTFRVTLGRKVLQAIADHHAVPGVRKRQSLQVTPLILGNLDNVFFWTSDPYQFIDPENESGVWDLLSDIDPGKANYHGRPVGGRVHHR